MRPLVDEYAKDYRGTRGQRNRSEGIRDGGVGITGPLVRREGLDPAHIEIPPAKSTPYCLRGEVPGGKLMHHGGDFGLEVGHGSQSSSFPEICDAEPWELTLEDVVESMDSAVASVCILGIK